MCKLVSAVCQGCDFHRARYTTHCLSYWRAIWEYTTHGKEKPTPEDCDDAEFVSEPMRLGDCPNLPYCASMEPWQRYKIQKARAQREHDRKKWLRIKGLVQKRKEFAQKYFQKKPVAPVAVDDPERAPVSFMEMCRRDEDLKIAKALEERERENRRIEQVIQQFRMDPDAVLNACVFDDSDDDELPMTSMNGLGIRDQGLVLDEAGPSNAQEAGPSNAAEAGPSNSKFARSSNTTLIESETIPPTQDAAAIDIAPIAPGGPVADAPITTQIRDIQQSARPLAQQKGKGKAIIVGRAESPSYMAINIDKIAGKRPEVQGPLEHEVVTQREARAPRPEHVRGVEPEFGRYCLLDSEIKRLHLNFLGVRDPVDDSDDEALEYLFEGCQERNEQLGEEMETDDENDENGADSVTEDVLFTYQHPIESIECHATEEQDDGSDDNDHDSDDDDNDVPPELLIEVVAPRAGPSFNLGRMINKVVTAAIPSRLRWLVRKRAAASTAVHATAAVAERSPIASRRQNEDNNSAGATAASGRHARFPNARLVFF